MSGRILVVRGGAIGDFILTLPVLAALRKQFPRTQIEVLGYPHVASLAKLAGYANEVRSIEARPLAGFFARHGKLDEGLSEYFGAFNIIISYLYDPDQIFQDNIARCSKAQFVAGPHRPNDTGNIHATEVFLKPLERLAIFDADPVPRLKIAEREPRDAHTLAIHPGSGSDKKNWPEDHWQQLFRLMARETDWRMLLVGGEAEEERLQRLSSLLPVVRFQVAFRQPLTELAARMERCGAFIGHDSGITHLAAAIGLRGLALWGETSQDVWRPRGNFQILCEEKGLPNIDPSQVFKAVSKIFNGD